MYRNFLPITSTSFMRSVCVRGDREREFVYVLLEIDWSKRTDSLSLSLSLSLSFFFNKLFSVTWRTLHLYPSVVLPCLLVSFKS